MSGGLCVAGLGDRIVEFPRHTANQSGVRGAGAGKAANGQRYGALCLSGECGDGLLGDRAVAVYSGQVHRQIRGGADDEVGRVDGEETFGGDQEAFEFLGASSPFMDRPKLGQRICAPVGHLLTAQIGQAEQRRQLAVQRLDASRTIRDGAGVVSAHGGFGDPVMQGDRIPDPATDPGQVANNEGARPVGVIEQSQFHRDRAQGLPDASVRDLSGFDADSVR